MLCRSIEGHPASSLDAWGTLSFPGRLCRLAPVVGHGRTAKLLTPTGNAPQGARSPAVRIRPCGRVALASAGLALMGFGGSPEARERKVVPRWFGTPGKPFRRRPGLPFRTAGREPSPATTPLMTSRAPTGLAEDRCRSRGPAAPSRASCPFSACGAADSVDAGLPHPPPSVLSVSRALDGLHPATPARACFIPITLMGFRLQGLAPLRGPYPSRGRCSRAVGVTRRSR
jgi:hypothetical protein